MGHEYIGECSTDREFGDYETELTIKYLKHRCGAPPRGVDIEITWEGYEIGGGDETQYPVISVVWDDFAIPRPDEYIDKCYEACERFDLPEEIHDRYQKLFELQEKIPKLLDPD
jgi:hypothetical protein